MSGACVACLRRGRLVGLLAPRIAAALGGRARVPPGLLSLADDALIGAVAGGGARAAAQRLLERFDAAAERRTLDAAGVAGLCRHDPRYPAGLGSLGDPPAVLYVSGALERFLAAVAPPVVAIVGARRASPYALEVAQALARGMAAARVSVVSGLALGVDAAAHRGALSGDGATVAVVAGGPDVPYPRTNRALHARVRDAGGIVSELPPGQPVLRWAFPARNRIMAGLAAMTVVVEAAEGSGSLITADFAAQLGREVGAVPGRITARMAAGSNRLLKDGAVPVLGARDLLDALFGAGAGPVEPDGGGAPAGPGSPPPAGPGSPPSPGPDPRVDAALEPRLRRVLDEVEAGARVDAIGAALGLRAAPVRAALGRLELLGLVRRDGLGGYVRTAAS